jgi:ligand-binding sensor domain-containing protein
MNPFAHAPEGIHFWRERHLWFATEDGEIDRYDGKTLMRNPVDGSLSTNRINRLVSTSNTYKSEEGLLWLYGNNGGDGYIASRFDGQRFTTSSIPNDLMFDKVNAVAEGPDGVLWFATSKGLSRLDGTRFTHFTTRDGLPQENIIFARTDSTGHLWLSTRGGGIIRFDGLVFQSLNQRDGLAHNVAHRFLQDGRGDW